MRIKSCDKDWKSRDFAPPPLRYGDNTLHIEVTPVLAKPVCLSARVSSMCVGAVISPMCVSAVVFLMCLSAVVSPMGFSTVVSPMCLSAVFPPTCLSAVVYPMCLSAVVSGHFRQLAANTRREKKLWAGRILFSRGIRWWCLDVAVEGRCQGCCKLWPKDMQQPAEYITGVHAVRAITDLIYSTHMCC